MAKYRNIFGDEVKAVQWTGQDIPGLVRPGQEISLPGSSITNEGGDILVHLETGVLSISDIESGDWVLTDEDGDTIILSHHQFSAEYSEVEDEEEAEVNKINAEIERLRELVNQDFSEITRLAGLLVNGPIDEYNIGWTQRQIIILARHADEKKKLVENLGVLRDS